MYLNSKAEIILSDHTHQCGHPKIDVFWEGFAFIKGQRPGQESISVLMDEWERMGPAQASSILSGSFTCFVKDKETNTCYAFTDNGRYNPVFYTHDTVGSSFLELSRQNGLGAADLDHECLVECILTGFQFTEKIFFKQVKILNADEILIISPGKTITLEPKSLSDPFLEEPASDPVAAFMEVMDRITRSIQGMRVSVDLTGGTDTRLTAAALDHLGLDFETAVSGTPQFSDMTIAADVSKVLGPHHTLYPVPHEVRPDSLWSEIGRMVKSGDGVWDVVSSHRLYGLIEDRKKRGLELSIGGSGGELHKDGGWWRAAFFMRPGRDGTKRLIDDLVESGLGLWGMGRDIPYNIIPERYHDLCRGYKPKVREYLTKRYLPTSENKYILADRIFYEFSVRAPRGFRHNVIDNYVPLLDPEIVAIGVHLPRQARFLHRFYREVISSINPSLANMPTSRDDMRMNRGWVECILDICRMSRYRLNKPAPVPKNNPNLFICLRESPELTEILDRLRDYGYLAPGIAVDDISDAHLGRFITLSKTLEILG